MAVTHAIGRPENDSERRAISYLGEHLPGSDYVLFHNLELPTPSGLPYEYDLVVVGEYAVYMIEVKGYRGRIQGNASEWELDSGAIIKSPIPLANKKAKVLKSRLVRHSPLLDQVWVQPLIALTDDRVLVRLNDDQADRVLHLNEVVAYIFDPRRFSAQSTPITHLIDKACEAIFNQFRPLRRQQEIGDYRVLETIGKNDLYTTLLAEHRMIRTRKRFTLKVYSFDVYAGDEAQRKQREWIMRDTNALHRLTAHPNIVQAYPPFPWQDNKVVLPLEWVEGFSLRGLVDSQTGMSLARKLDIVRQICLGARHAHLEGIVHRDIRPDNVIVPAEGPVKLVNFDCARVEGGDLQTIATRVGRQLDERYVSPEVWQDARVASPLSDQFSIGIILFELLTGRPPYQKIKQFMAAKGLPQLPTQIDPTLPADLDEVAARMCAFKAQDRYAGLEETIEDLSILGS